MEVILHAALVIGTSAGVTHAVGVVYSHRKHQLRRNKIAALGVLTYLLSKNLEELEAQLVLLKNYDQASETCEEIERRVELASGESKRDYRNRRTRMGDALPFSS